MEVTKELHQCFVETEKQREERRRPQKLNVQHLGSYVNADPTTATAIREARGQAEMKGWYGGSAPKILATEAPIQLSFDKKGQKQPMLASHPPEVLGPDTGTLGSAS